MWKLCGIIADEMRNDAEGFEESDDVLAADLPAVESRTAQERKQAPEDEVHHDEVASLREIDSEVCAEYDLEALGRHCEEPIVEASLLHAYHEPASAQIILDPLPEITAIAQRSSLDVEDEGIQDVLGMPEEDILLGGEMTIVRNAGNARSFRYLSDGDPFQRLLRYKIQKSFCNTFLCYGFSRHKGPLAEYFTMSKGIKQ